MKALPNLTEDQLIQQINIVVNRIAPRYVFYGYQLDDVKQESWIICMDALERYDSDMGELENFLSVNLSNRLKNLIRKEHYNKETAEDKKRLKMPGQLSNEEVSHFYETFPLESLDLKELAHIIDTEIPYKHRANYIKLINNDHVPKKEKEELVQLIKDIAAQYGYEQEEEEEW